MARLTKSEAQVILDTFFDEVDKARKYLSRNIQDGDHRRERLGVMAGEMMRPRTPIDFATWLASAIGEALGAEAGITMVHEGTWRILGEWKKPQALLGSSLYRRAESGDLSEITEEPIQSPSGETPALVHLGVPIFGEHALVAIVLLDTVYSVTQAERELVLAMMGTVGVLLEQGLQLQSVSQNENNV